MVPGGCSFSEIDWNCRCKLAYSGGSRARGLRRVLYVDLAGMKFQSSADTVAAACDAARDWNAESENVRLPIQIRGIVSVQ
jgi:hypothetical protein